MARNSKENRINEEIENLSYILSIVEDNKKKLADRLIQEFAFVKISIEDTKVIINREGIVEQTVRGLKESPATKTYKTLVTILSNLSKQICDLIPENKDEEVDELLAFMNDK